MSNRQTLTTNVPLWNGLGMNAVPFSWKGRAEDADNNKILTPVCTVEPSYFETLNIPIVAGRALSEIDRQGAPNVVVINETTAKRFWPDENPVGSRFHFFGQDEIIREVVGGRQRRQIPNGGRRRPGLYLYAAGYRTTQPGMSLVIRTNGPLDSVLATVRNEVQQLDRALPITDVQTMSEIMRLGLWPGTYGGKLAGRLSVFWPCCLRRSESTESCPTRSVSVTVKSASAWLWAPSGVRSSRSS